MDRRCIDGRKRPSKPVETTARKSSRKIAVLTLTIPQPLSDRAEAFLGPEVASDPAFWMIALSTGIEELERQFREIEADARKDADNAGHVVIFGAPTIIDLGTDHHHDDDPDAIPF